VHEVAAKYRFESRQQEAAQIAAAKANGVEFFKLSDADMTTLRKQGAKTHENFREEINQLRSGDTYRPADYLKEVQEYMGFE
ncbi:MAG: C4-dicarboxylate ABC transporter substrate-binding protein, partial [SAR324 cluster bacterium]|nr:C4-dicarboxylate ABC transporter substrate-binding protein [SAR324 cluster bacterium]